MFLVACEKRNLCDVILEGNSTECLSLYPLPFFLSCVQLCVLSCISCGLLSCVCVLMEAVGSVGVVTFEMVFLYTVRFQLEADFLTCVRPP